MIKSEINTTTRFSVGISETTKKKLKRYKSLYLLIIPAMAIVLTFQYVPLFGVIMAFQDFDIFKGFLGSEFVGLLHFKKIFSEPRFLLAIKNTMIFSSVNLFFGFPMPIILALLLNELRNMKFKRIVQTISYLPHFLSWISVVALFYTMFAMQGPFNEIRAFFAGDGFKPTNILMNAKYFVWIIYSSNLWKSVGWSSVVYLAAIAGIDQEQYEAATIDGCGRFKKVLHITIPSIIPTVLILFILNVGNLVNSNFEQIYGFQNLYTVEQTEVINTLVYRIGIQNGDYSLSTAFGLAQGLVSCILVLTVNKIVKKLGGNSLW